MDGGAQIDDRKCESLWNLDNVLKALEISEHYHYYGLWIVQSLGLHATVCSTIVGVVHS